METLPIPVPRTTVPPWGSVTCSAAAEPHRLAFSGEVDIALEESLGAVFSFLSHSRPSDVAICLHDVTFLDSTGLDFLVRVQDEVHRSGRSLRLVAPSVVVRWVLRIAGLIGVFAVEEATPAAVAACECRTPRIDGVRVVVPGQRTVGMGTVGMEGAAGMDGTAGMEGAAG
ncbi:MAG: hypothetical protein JWN54_1028 [Mycobacterium sp.]|nr:hypothetical protein [Mycobacterium sp.]